MRTCLKLLPPAQHLLALPVQAQSKRGQNGRQIQCKRVPSSPKLAQEEFFKKTGLCLGI